MVQVAMQNKSAFTILVDRYVDALYNYAYRLSRSRSLADDLVQETWLAVWRNAVSFRPRKARVSTWLHKILHNKFIDATRKSVREQPLTLEVYETHEQADDGYVSKNPETMANTSEQAMLLLRRIEELPETQRAAIMLTHAQGFSNKEVAHIMGLSVRATESALSRARRTLRETSS